MSRVIRRTQIFARPRSRRGDVVKNYSLADMLAGAINLVKTGDVQPGEQVCILTDTRSYP